MISYELAKELNDAGFPQKDLGGYDFADDINYPTLAELIEACGDHLFSLQNHWHQRGQWMASLCGDRTDDGKGVTFHPFVGQTPEEAVAKVWLALNRA